VPSLRARDCDKNEKDALNYAFLVRAIALPPPASPTGPREAVRRSFGCRLFSNVCVCETPCECALSCACLPACLLATSTPTLKGARQYQSAPTAASASCKST